MACFGRTPTEFFCHIVLLDESEFPIEITKSTKGFEVLEKVFDHLNLLERDYFGLRFIEKNTQSRWLDPMKSVTKQLKAGPPYLMYFCVKFYAADPNKLHEELTRYLFFLQVKRDIFQGRLPCPQNVLAELSGYAIQSELGDFDYQSYTPGYVSEFRFVPKQTEDLEEKISDCHKRLIGVVPSVAEYMYLDKAKWLEMYGVDLHLVKGEDGVEYFVALKPAGVVVYHNKTAVGTYLWQKITKIDFKGKKFSLNVQGKEDREYVYVFYLPNKSACKHLWKCCVEHHAFFRLDRVKPVSQSSSGLFRTGSGFRYSGRTQKEALEEGRRLARPNPQVKRKPSKRYERRTSQSNDRAQGNVTVVSTAHVQVRADDVQAMNVSGVKSDGRPSSSGQDVYDGSRQSTHGPALPWEELAQTQAGLYTPAPESPRSVRSNNSTGRSKRRSRSPKFPRPHSRRSGQSSGSETEPSKRRSRSAYYSDDDVGRRKRHHKRKHHRHAHSAAEYSGSDGESLPSRRGRRKAPRPVVNPQEVAKLGDAAPYHWDKVTGEEFRPRHHHHNHHRHAASERDARSDGSGRHRHSRSVTSEPPDPPNRRYPMRPKNGHIPSIDRYGVTKQADYIEVVSGPPINQRADPLITNYNYSPRRAMQTGKSTVL
ncbi:band 4.1-like protein 5 isoform X2 [Nematostella vectensis]|uniref:band 4.1-like protein 5 isoform X2 n=1 Tax=Nematostella vectensis TaxID=45351 RepID=UPI00207743ED|nr:band 4.1-like protein 5 isoform X2 [Nematostella vectensis]